MRIQDDLWADPGGATPGDGPSHPQGSPTQLQAASVAPGARILQNQAWKNLPPSTIGSARAWGTGYGLFPGRTSCKAFPGSLWRPDLSQRPMDGPGRHEDVMEHKDTGAILAEKAGCPLPLHKWGEGGSEKGATRQRPHSTQRQYVGPGPESNSLWLWGRGPPQPQCPPPSPGLATAPRMYFMNERTKNCPPCPQQAGAGLFLLVLLPCK